MKRKVSVTLWYDVTEKLPLKSGVYLCYDGYDTMALPFSAKHKAFGVTDSMPASKVDWCKVHPIEWAEIPDFVETVAENIIYDLLLTVDSNINIGIDYLNEAIKVLSLINKREE